jgi:uncharacterized Ntn-hydrolase superfamily protein
VIRRRVRRELGSSVRSTMPRLIACISAAIALLVSPLAATWSILLIDLRTGEIAIAAATCLPDFDLRRTLPIVLVGRGVAAAQSDLDGDGQNRVFILTNLAAGMDPAQILGLLAGRDQDHDRRQYGIVDLVSRTADHTGNSVPSFSGERSGRVGDVVWQVQGNLLAGPGVLDAIETALGATHLDLPTRLMAAMEAAHAAGGDGRCSCDVSRPTSCGSPPSNFTKSSHCAFLIVARPGDQDGTCNANGCANGRYFTSLDVANQPASAPDAVLQLRARFDAWAAARQGRVDHFVSTMALAHQRLPADGASETRLRVELRDRLGSPITRTNLGFTLAVEPAGAVALGSATALGNGVHELRLVAGTQATTARVSAVAIDGSESIRLGPPLELALVDDPLWCAQSTLSIQSGGALEFVLRSDDPQPRLFSLLASASGSTPGIPLGPGLVLPLMPDLLLEVTASAWFHGSIPGLYGITPAAGRATSTVSFPPGLWGLPPGLELSWAFAFWHPLDTVSNPVTVRVVM